MTHRIGRLITGAVIVLAIVGSASAQPGDPLHNWLVGKRLVFNHPQNGMLYFYTSVDGWFLARLNLNGQAIGEGGRWSARVVDRPDEVNEKWGRNLRTYGMLCLESIKGPQLSGCGALLLFENGAVLWEHKLTVDLHGRIDASWPPGG